MTPPRKPVLGLVGGIGAGKSTAAAHLAARGGRVIDADRIAHDVLDSPAVRAEVLARWGHHLTRPDGRIDRRALGGVVFADAAQRKELEAIMFPAIGERVREQTNAANLDPAVRFVVLDAAVMLEAGWHGACDRLLYIDAPTDDRRRRVLARSGWSADELAKREAAQMPAGEKQSLAGAVVMNDSTADVLADRLDAVLVAWGLLPAPGGIRN